MNVESILNYKADPDEDFYALLGCDASASAEQINAEFKVRARDFHPDKNSEPSSQAHFQLLLRAKETLVDPKERKLYDAWRSSGISMSFAQWRGLKDSVKASMHWATPKTSGRMLDSVGTHKEAANEPISLNPSPIKEDDLLEAEMQKRLEHAEDDATSYAPTSYGDLGLRISTPPPTWSSSKEENKENKSEVKDDKVDSVTALRRRQFAVRRESTIGAMVMAEKWEDNEIRRRFRNYEI